MPALVELDTTTGYHAVRYSDILCVKHCDHSFTFVKTKHDEYFVKMPYNATMDLIDKARLSKEKRTHVYTTLKELVVHPLQHFLAEAPAVFDSDVYVTEKEFRQRFKVFCEENGYSQRIPWSKEFYGSVFEGKGIKLVTDILPDGKLKSGKFICGIKFQDNEQ